MKRVKKKQNKNSKIETVGIVCCIQNTIINSIQPLILVQVVDISIQFIGISIYDLFLLKNCICMQHAEVSHSSPLCCYFVFILNELFHFHYRRFLELLTTLMWWDNNSRCSMHFFFSSLDLISTSQHHFQHNKVIKRRKRQTIGLWFAMDSLLIFWHH